MIPRSFRFSHSHTLATLTTLLLALLLHQSLTPTRRGSCPMPPPPPLKNIVVVGGSYVGQAVAKELLSTLNPEEEYRVVVVERNSHFGHLFAYPRFSISPSGHEHKAFLPFSPMLPQPHGVVQAEAVGIELRDEGGGGGKVLLDRGVRLPAEEEEGEEKREVEFEALVIATGTKLSKPGTLDPEKRDAVAYLQSVQKRLGGARDVVIIGGGAVGVQMATDLAVLYPFTSHDTRKNITLIHSRPHLMPRFHPSLHEIVSNRLEELGVKTVLGVRAREPEGGWDAFIERLGRGEKGEVEVSDGRRVRADYVIVALGQSPFTSLLLSSLPSAINPSNGFVRVKPSLLVDPADAEEGRRADARVWAVGDVADSGAPKAARPALQQAKLVAQSIAKRLAGEGESSFSSYTPSPAAIHLTLGFRESVIFRNPPSSLQVDEKTGEKRTVWEGEPQWEWKEDGREDMGIEAVWERRLPGFVGGDKSRYHL